MDNKCMYEDHYFNNKTNKWEILDKGRICYDFSCTRKHKYERPSKLCPLNINCPNAGISCLLLHNKSDLKTLCKYGKNCCDIECQYRHPTTRTIEICNNSRTCEDSLITCFRLHYISSIKPLCKYKTNCVNFMCNKLLDFHFDDKQSI